jgi:D-alanine transaminase
MTPDWRTGKFAYLNGRFIPRVDAKIDVEDRATLFGDAVYEVVRYYAGRPFAMREHLDRLAQSLRGMEITPPQHAASLDRVSDELLQRNALTDASVYWHISRGVAPRRHVPQPDLQPTVFALAYPAPPLPPRDSPPSAERIITVPDIRWANCWIKSTMLFPNALARTHAASQGCGEAFFLRGELVTEGAATSAAIVLDGVLRTHPTDGSILPSVTRAIALELARNARIPVEERAFTLSELLHAQEAMFWGTTSHVCAVTHVNSQPIAKAQPGPITRTLHRAFLNHVAQACGIT